MVLEIKFKLSMAYSSVHSVSGDIQNSGTVLETGVLPLTSSPASPLPAWGAMFSSLHALVRTVPSARHSLPHAWPVLHFFPFKTQLKFHFFVELSPDCSQTKSTSSLFSLSTQICVSIYFCENSMALISNNFLSSFSKMYPFEARAVSCLWFFFPPLYYII